MLMNGAEAVAVSFLGGTSDFDIVSLSISSVGSTSLTSWGFVAFTAFSIFVGTRVASSVTSLVSTRAFSADSLLLDEVVILSTFPVASKTTSSSLALSAVAEALPAITFLSAARFSRRRCLAGPFLGWWR